MKQNIEKLIAYTTAVSFLGTIISLFFNNWKVTIILLIIYVMFSDLYLGYKVAEATIKKGLNDVVTNLFNQANIENEED